MKEDFKMLVPSIFRDSLFDDFMDGFGFPTVYRTQEKEQQPLFMRTDVKELENGYELSIDLPGYSKENVQLSLKKGYLTISAETTKNNDEKDENGRYIRRQLKEGGLFAYKCALNPHMGIYNDLYNSIVNNPQPIADAYAGYSSVDTMMGIYKSAKENRQISLPLTEDFSTVDMTGYFN